MRCALPVQHSNTEYNLFRVMGRDSGSEEKTPHLPPQRLRPFPLRCVPAGPRLRSFPKAEDFAPAHQGHAAKIKSLREAPTIQPSQNPPGPPGAQTTPVAAPFMVSAAHRQTGFVFGCSHASEVRRGCLAASGLAFVRSLPRGLERAREVFGATGYRNKSLCVPVRSKRTCVAFASSV